MENCLRISEKANVIIRAMGYMALKNQGEFSSVKEISDAISVGRGYIAKVLQPMASKGLLLSIRGVGGGFYIAAKSRTMTLLEILLVIEDEYFELESFCFNKKCILSKLNDEINRLIKDKLSGVTLTDFAKMSFSAQ